MLHEAVQHEGDGGEGSRPVIGTVMRHGYKLGDSVLRHALVGVVDTVQKAGPRRAGKLSSPTRAITTTPQANRAQNQQER